MKRWSKYTGLSLAAFLLLLLIVLSLGFVEVSSGVMLSLFLSIIFILALVALSKVFAPKKRSRKR